MRSLNYHTQPQNTRIEPAFFEVSEAGRQPQSPEGYTKFELVSSGKPIDWGAIIVPIMSKAIDKTGDIAGLMIVYGFTFLGQIFIGFFQVIGQLLKMGWKAWTTCPADQFDRPDNYGHYEQEPVDNRTIIIENHYHF